MRTHLQPTVMKGIISSREKCKPEGENSWGKPRPDTSLQKICKHQLGLNLRYCSNFYGKAAADSIFQELESQLVPYFSSCQQTVALGGRVQPIPRRHAAFGDHRLSYSFSGITMRATPWIPLISSLRDHVGKALGGETFNFVLVNRYKDGYDHMGEHRDNEQELVPIAPIASLSFGQTRDFVLRHRDSCGRRGGRGGGGGSRGGTGACVEEPVKLELGHGSLLVMCPPTNSMWYHSLPVRRRALHPRINLTFRRMVVATGHPANPSTNRLYHW